MFKTTIIVLALLVLAISQISFEQVYRYPCQDPSNWHTEECQRPICEVNRDCPEYIFEGNNRIKLPPGQSEINGVNK